MLARSLACVVGFIAAFATSAVAAEPSLVSLMALEKSLHYQTGDIAVGSHLATLHLGEKYRFLDADDANKVIVEGWGNPPGAAKDVLGMITPAKRSPLGAESWGVVVSYHDEGHVKDDDAAKIDYAEMLTTLKTSIDESNEKRTSQGFPTLHLVGWAQAPSYDAAAKKLIWAKELAFGDKSEHTLNYDVRVLGRRGVLSMNAVGTMDDLPAFQSAMADVATHAEFVVGERYADFNSSSGDKMAAYGVAGLIVGGVAAKAGLFKGLIVLIVALKKFVIIGFVALVAGVRKAWGAITGRNGASASPATPPAA